MNHTVVSPEEWVKKRKAFLEREKQLTHLRDQIASERRALPWTRIDKGYVFETRQGPRGLADLFAGRAQLMLQHFMLAPDWEAGCTSCSFMADHTDSMAVHLAQRDVTVVAVSRAPIDRIERFRARMGWKFNWVSSHANDFNYDFHVSFTQQQQASGSVYYNWDMGPARGEEAPGISVFCKDAAGDVFLTYSTFGRGVEVMMGTYNILDLMPAGRAERDVPYKMEWVRHHDRYEADAPKPVASACCSANAQVS